MTADVLNPSVKSLEWLLWLLLLEDGGEGIRQLIPPLLIVVLEIIGVGYRAKPRDNKLLGALVGLEGRSTRLRQVEDGWPCPERLTHSGGPRGSWTRDSRPFALGTVGVRVGLPARRGDVV